jgi:hypothetical protein
MKAMPDTGPATAKALPPSSLSAVKVWPTSSEIEEGAPSIWNPMNQLGVSNRGKNPKMIINQRISGYPIFRQIQ